VRYSASRLPSLKEVLLPGGALPKCEKELEALLSKLESGSKGEMKRYVPSMSIAHFLHHWYLLVIHSISTGDNDVLPLPVELGMGGSSEASLTAVANRVGIRALKWPFSKSDVDKTVAVLDRCKASFSLALATDQVKLSLASGKDAEEHRKSEYKEKIVQWLYAIEPGINWSNHEDAWSKHQPNTGVWLVQDSDEFNLWKTTKDRVLWVQGLPGVGKTIMISHIIEHLKHFCEAEAKRVLTYFYFDFGTPAKQTAVSCARILLSQLVSRSADMPGSIKNLYDKTCSHGSKSPGIDDLTAMLTLYANCEDVEDLYIVLDAIDECSLKDGKRAELLEWLDQLTQKLSPKLHLCISGRPEQDICETLCSFPRLTDIKMEESKIGADIETYLRYELSRRPKFTRLPAELREEMQDALTRGAQGMSVTFEAYVA
jgi:hypothetical protein